MTAKLIAVIGGGIIGLTSAIRILEEVENAKVTLIAKDLSPDTTGDVSAGFWRPYLPGNIPEDTLKKWLEESFDFYLKFTKTAEAGAIGVGLVSVFDMLHSGDGSQLGSDQMLGYRSMTENELSAINPKAKEGKFYTSIVAQCNLFLPYLLQSFQSLGGLVRREEVASFQEFFKENFDVIVNCTGLSSSTLVPDPTVYPIRGQVLRVNAPWIKHVIVAGPFHVIPSANYVQIGGTAQKDNWKLKVDSNDTEKILEGCYELVPSLKGAEIIDKLVGLRPARSEGPRVEKDVLTNPDSNLTIPVIHNYGHGGSGVTLCWGCAGTVVQLLRQIV